MPTYTGDPASANLDAQPLRALTAASTIAAYRATNWDAAFYGIEVFNNALSLSKGRLGHVSYGGQAYTCGAGDAVGDPVRLSANGTVTKALASSEAGTRVIGFIRHKGALGAASDGTATTCYVYKFSEIETLSGTAFGQPLFLSDAGAVATSPGTYLKVIGMAYSATVGMLYANEPSALEFKTAPNLLHNGDFRVAQRGTTFDSTTSPINNNDIYLLDRWNLLANGSDTVDVSQFTSGAPAGSYSALRLDVETGNRKFGVVQFLESRDAMRVIGGNVSLSFKMRVVGGTSIGTVKACILSWSSTADAVTSDIVSAWGASGTTFTPVANWTLENTPAALTPTTSWATYTVADVALDTGSAVNIAVFIYNDDATTTVGEFLEITDVNLVAGPAPLPYQARTYQEELALCQRYCQSIISDGTVTQSFLGFGSASSTTVVLAERTLKVTMRAAPTLTPTPTAADWLASDGSGNTDLTAISLVTANSNADTIMFQATVAAGLTQFRPYRVQADSTSGRKLILDAEL